MKTYQIYAIKAFDDNYIWAIARDDQAVIIDPGSAAEVETFLQDHQLNLQAILITHHHNDHIGGVAALMDRYKDCALYAHSHHGVAQANAVDEGDIVTVLGLDFTVWQSFGHTDSHISYLVQIDGAMRVFCGDTLFSGGCGRVFTGTIEQLFASFQRYLTLSDDTLFYPAHEYTLSNLRFAKAVAVDGDLPQIDKMYDQVSKTLADGGISLPVSLDHEKDCNVFIQACNADKAKQIAMKNNLTDSSPLAVFTWLRESKNNF